MNTAPEFDRLPDPRYVLLTLTDVEVRTSLTVEYEVPDGGGGLTHHTTDPLEVPAGTPAGSSFLLDLKADEGPLLMLRKVHVVPAGPSPAADAWQVTALLGNLAKLLWVVGVERDLIRHEFRRITEQRSWLAQTVGASISTEVTSAYLASRRCHISSMKPPSCSARHFITLMTSRHRASRRLTRWLTPYPACQARRRSQALTWGARPRAGCRDGLALHSHSVIRPP